MVFLILNSIKSKVFFFLVGKSWKYLVYFNEIYFIGKKNRLETKE